MKYVPSAEKSMWLTPGTVRHVQRVLESKGVRVGEVELALGLRDDDGELAVRACKYML